MVSEARLQLTHNCNPTAVSRGSWRWCYRYETEEAEVGMLVRLRLPALVRGGRGSRLAIGVLPPSEGEGVILLQNDDKRELAFMQ